MTEKNKLQITGRCQKIIVINPINSSGISFDKFDNSVTFSGLKIKADKEIINMNEDISISNIVIEHIVLKTNFVEKIKTIFSFATMIFTERVFL